VSETNSPELRQLGCYAALQLSDYTLARELARGIGDPIESEFIEIALHEAEGGDPKEFIPTLLRIASSEPARPDQVSRALLQLARLGVQDEKALSRLGQQDESFAELVRARTELMSGESSKARRRLQRVKSSLALEMLTEVSVREGRIDDAVLRLRERFEATTNPTYPSWCAPT
jgi:hypothetical protein